MLKAIEVAKFTRRFSLEDFFLIYDADTLHDKNNV